MRKRTLLISALAAFIAVTVILILSSRPDARFDGDRISDPGRFVLRFERMNKTDSEAMALAEGDALRVSWQIESGHVDIKIGMEGEVAVYQADDRTAGDEADFCVEIPRAGTYTITVAAREAKGQIEFLKAKNE